MLPNRPPYQGSGMPVGYNPQMSQQQVWMNQQRVMQNQQVNTMMQMDQPGGMPGLMPSVMPGQMPRAMPGHMPQAMPSNNFPAGFAAMQRFPTAQMSSGVIQQPGVRMQGPGPNTPPPAYTSDMSNNYHQQKQMAEEERKHNRFMEQKKRMQQTRSGKTRALGESQLIDNLFSGLASTSTVHSKVEAAPSTGPAAHTQPPGSTDADDDFGDFLSTGSTQSQVAPVPQPATHQVPGPIAPQDEGPRQSFVTVVHAETKQRKKGLDDMLSECSDVSAPSKARTFKDERRVAASAPRDHKIAQFVSSNMSRDWKKTGESLGDLFHQTGSMNPEPSQPAVSEINAAIPPQLSATITQPTVSSHIQPLTSHPSQTTHIQQPAPYQSQIPPGAGPAFQTPAILPTPQAPGIAAHSSPNQQVPGPAPGPTPQVPGPTPQVPGPIPQVPGPTPQVPGPTPQVPGPTPQVPGPTSQVPGVLPGWCYSPQLVPPLYRHVVEAVMIDGVVNTERLYHILLRSELPRETLGRLWSLVNKEQSGVLAAHELCAMLALVALHQNDIPTCNTEILHRFNYPPVPYLGQAEKPAPLQLPAPNQASLQVPSSELHGTHVTPIDTKPVSQPTKPGSSPASVQAVPGIPDNLPPAHEPTNTTKQSKAGEVYTEGLLASMTSNDVVLPVYDDFEEFQSADTQKPAAAMNITQSATVDRVGSDLMDTQEDKYSALSSLALGPSDGPSLDPSTVSKSMSFAELKLGSTEAHDITERIAEWSPQPVDDEVDEFGDFAGAQESAGDMSRSSLSIPANLDKSTTRQTDIGEEQGAMNKDAIMDLFGSAQPNTRATKADDRLENDVQSTPQTLDNDEWADFASTQPAVTVPEPSDPVISQASELGASDLMTHQSDQRASVSSTAPSKPKPASKGSILQHFQMNAERSKNNSSFGAFVDVAPPPLDDQELEVGLDSAADRYPGLVDDDTSKTSLPPQIGRVRSPIAEDKQSVRSLELPKLNPDDTQSIGSLELTKGVVLSGSASVASLELAANDTPSSGDEKLAEQEVDTPRTLTEADQAATTDSAQTSVQAAFDSAPLPILGERYSGILDEVEESERPGREWPRALKQALNLLQEANTTIGSVSSVEVCRQVTGSTRGTEYLSALTEIFKVVCRIETSHKEAVVASNECLELIKQIHLQWNNLLAFIGPQDFLPSQSSLNFCSSVIPRDMNEEIKRRACGICLLNVDVTSTPGQTTVLSYAGREYHAPCANYWLNCVESTLPALCLPQLL